MRLTCDPFTTPIVLFTWEHLLEDMRQVVGNNGGFFMIRGHYFPAKRKNMQYTTPRAHVRAEALEIVDRYEEILADAKFFDECLAVLHKPCITLEEKYDQLPDALGRDLNNRWKEPRQNPPWFRLEDRHKPTADAFVELGLKYLGNRFLLS